MFILHGHRKEENLGNSPDTPCFILISIHLYISISIHLYIYVYIATYDL